MSVRIVLIRGVEYRAFEGEGLDCSFEGAHLGYFYFGDREGAHDCFTWKEMLTPYGGESTSRVFVARDELAL